MDAVHSRVSQLRDDMNEAEKRLMSELNDINKWRWQMMGAAAGVAALISIATKLMPM